MKQLHRDIIELCAFEREWNNQPCMNPADVIYFGVPMCAECVNRSGILYYRKDDPH